MFDHHCFGLVFFIFFHFAIRFWLLSFGFFLRTFGSTDLAFDGYGLCDSLPARPAKNASYPVSVRQAAVLLRTSFRRPLAAAALVLC